MPRETLQFDLCAWLAEGEREKEGERGKKRDREKEAEDGRRGRKEGNMSRRKECKRDRYRRVERYKEGVVRGETRICLAPSRSCIAVDIVS